MVGIGMGKGTIIYANIDDTPSIGVICSDNWDSVIYLLHLKEFNLNQSNESAIHAECDDSPFSSSILRASGTYIKVNCPA